MRLDEVIISRGIIQKYMEELQDYLDIDVAVTGGGPSGIVAAYYLAKNGAKVALIDKKLSIGGGMWGGGMMFNKIVLQEESKEILNDLEIKCEEYQKGYYIADSINVTAKLIVKASDAGAKIFNLISAEDLVVHNNRVAGLVLNWTPVVLNNLHVDPLVLRSKYVIDATGHPAVLLSILTEKMGVKINTPTGKVAGEKSMFALEGEKDVVVNTQEVYPGIVVTGMAANAAFGSHRMGPVFGGMLLSGRKGAQLILEGLSK